MKTLVPDHKKKLTKQSVFDIVWKRAKIKKQATILKNSRCVYRTNNKKNCCFIGALIPDSKYKKEMEEVGGFWTILYDLREIFAFDTKNNHVFFADLQKIHDANEPSQWEHMLKLFAEEHKLIVPKN